MISAAAAMGVTAVCEFGATTPAPPRTPNVAYVGVPRAVVEQMVQEAYRRCAFTFAGGGE